MAVKKNILALQEKHILMMISAQEDQDRMKREEHILRMKHMKEEHEQLMKHREEEHKKKVIDCLCDVEH